MTSDTTLLRTAERPALEVVQAFYTAYNEALDDGRLDEWPDFFTDAAVYQVIPRENHDAGSELCLMQAEGRGMLVDRVSGILKTQKYAPQRIRRFYSGLRIVGTDEHSIRTRQNVLVIQSPLDRPSAIQLCGVAYDTLVAQGEALRFARRVVVADTELIDSAMILPV